MKLDKLLLKDNRLIYSKFYLFGSTFKSTLSENQYFAIKALNENNRIYKLLYSGAAIGIRPYQLVRILASTLDKKELTGNNYKDYLLEEDDSDQTGLSIKASYNTAIKKFENLYGYFPAYVMILQIQDKPIKPFEPEPDYKPKSKRRKGDTGKWNENFKE